MRERARIMLLAAGRIGSRAIGPGTASKWRVCYARDRMDGLSETGDRGAEPKYGPEHGQRILALLDQPPPAGYSNWTAPLLAHGLVDIHEQYVVRGYPEDRPCRGGNRGASAQTPTQRGPLELTNRIVFDNRRQRGRQVLYHTVLRYLRLSIWRIVIG
jgi:hypothetical protein